MLGIPLIVSRQGMVGIKTFKNFNYPMIYKNEKDMIKKIILLNKNYNKYVFTAKKVQINYRYYYSMKNVITKFIHDNNI